MRHKFAKVLILLLLFSISCARKQATEATATLIIVHATIIDTTGGPNQADMAVFIAGDRITDVKKGRHVRAPRGIQVVDATGKYLVPGLWDMHVHWYHEKFLSLFIANGVTGVRQMSGFPMHLDWRDKATRGELLAPHQVIASTIVDGPGATMTGSIEVGNEKQAREAVKKIKSSGFDFVKIYGGLPREAFYALADEAANQGLSFAGHVPYSVSALEASDAGQKCIEHLSGVLEACSPAGSEITQGYLRYTAGVNDRKGMSTAGRKAIRDLREKMLATYDETRANTLFAHFVQNGTWHCPTRTAMRAVAFIDESDLRNDPRLKYMPKYYKSIWQPENNPLWASRSAEDYTVAKRLYKREMKMIGEMRQAGVRFLAGTDTANPFCFPGFSLHDELTLLVEAGFTPMEALQAATINPANFLGTAESFGTIEKGKIADLVLLEANPLEHIENTKSIAAVVLGGKIFERSQLNEMLAKADKIANQKPSADILMKTIEEQDVAAAIRQYDDLKTRDPDAYDLGESQLIRLGYRLLSEKRVKDAIEIFRLNAAEHSQSSYAFSCLGEAYMAEGDKESAVMSLKKALELDSGNSDAAALIKKLGR